MATYDRDSSLYDSTLSVSESVSFYNIYAGTDADFKKNSVCSFDKLADGAISCSASVTSIVLELNRYATSPYSGQYL